MSEGEQKLVDTSGDFLYAIKQGTPVENPEWRSCQVILTNERLVLSTGGGRKAIPHSKILLPDEDMLPDHLRETGGTPIRIGNNVILIDTQDIEDFESEYCRSALHDEVILVKYPAVIGGVIQDDSEWSKARFRLEDEQISFGLPGNETVRFPIQDVGTVETDSWEVMGEQRQVVKVEHTNEEAQSVQTFVSGTDWHCRALDSLLGGVIEQRGTEDRELDDIEKQVLMALYSGVSPFEISDFVGVEIEEVEAIYENLLEIGALDKVRERTEVTLNAHGRNLASEAMNEE